MIVDSDINTVKIGDTITVNLGDSYQNITVRILDGKKKIRVAYRRNSQFVDILFSAMITRNNRQVQYLKKKKYTLSIQATRGNTTDSMKYSIYGT